MLAMQQAETAKRKAEQKLVTMGVGIQPPVVSVGSNGGRFVSVQPLPSRPAYNFVRTAAKNLTR